MKVTKLDEVQYCFVVKNNTKNIDYKMINKLSDLKNQPLILPIPGTSNRKDLDELLLNQNIDVQNVINIHTSEMIISAVKKDLGIGYIIYNLVDDDIKNGELEILILKKNCLRWK